MKILFISTCDVSLTRNGGELCTNRNYLSLCEIAGKENVEVINLMEYIPKGIKNAILKRFNFFKGYFEGLTRLKMTRIMDASKDKDLVFINSSTHGTIAKYLRKHNFKKKIITFFHNVEYYIKRDQAKEDPWKLIEISVIKNNEFNACRYSDKIILLNKRDEKEISSLYPPVNITIIPISLVDKFKGGNEHEIHQPPKFLFTGNNWYANIHGIGWFIDHVLDNVDISLQITGHKMDEIKHKLEHPKIDFLGFVDDLPKVLSESDFVLLPIFIGSGMKVKTCEALMHGKNIIGTTESFEGYDIIPNEIGALCNTKEEFIEAIQKLTKKCKSNFNSRSREIYLEKYSYNSTLKAFENIIMTK